MAQTSQTKEAFEAFAAGDYRAALKLYTEALDANPTVYQSLNDYPQAATWFRRFLRRTANSKDAHFDEMRKYARQFLQKFEQAKK